MNTLPRCACGAIRHDNYLFAGGKNLLLSLVNNGLPEAKSSTKRSSAASKRPRQPVVAGGDKSQEEDTPPFNNGGTEGGVANNRAKENAVSAVVVGVSGTSTASNGKPPKKKVKTVKKRWAWQNDGCGMLVGVSVEPSGYPNGLFCLLPYSTLLGALCV